MKRILFLTNYASPYRVRFFDELGKSAQVTVLYSDRRGTLSHRDEKWFEEGEGGFRSVQLSGAIGKGRRTLCFSVLRWLKRDYDAIIVAGYSSPTAILAMLWMRMLGIPFYMEIDGGLIRESTGARYQIKRFLVRLPSGWLTTGKYPTHFLTHYGADPERIIEYPFSSLFSGDILPEVPTRAQKQAMREKLGIPEKRMILAVGQFIYRKGFDVLLHGAKALPDDVGIYIVGGEADERYTKLREELGLEKNVHFWGFRPRQELAELYMAADLFCLPTREDIWGLVVNEAMAFGLPVVTTEQCVAGLELVENGVNGYLVPIEDPDALAESLNRVLSADMEAMGRASLQKIQGYTIEKMAQAHLDLVKEKE